MSILCVDLLFFIFKAVIHEAMRIFCDKLVSDSDKSKFHNLVVSVMDSDWNKANLHDELKGNSQIF